VGEGVTGDGVRIEETDGEHKSKAGFEVRPPAFVVVGECTGEGERAGFGESEELDVEAVLGSADGFFSGGSWRAVISSGSSQRRAKKPASLDSAVIPGLVEEGRGVRSFACCVVKPIMTMRTPTIWEPKTTSLLASWNIWGRFPRGAVLLLWPPSAAQAALGNALLSCPGRLVARIK
jgi:hypothetical protein